MPKMPYAPWPAQSTLVEKRIEDAHMASHSERVAKARESKTIDNDEPEHMHHLDYNAKKAEAERERQYEVDAENLRVYQKLAAIEDLDSSKIIKPSTSRSTLLSTPGMYRADVGSGSAAQCIDHINVNASVTPGSLHYRGSRPASRAGSGAATPAVLSRQSSRAGSAHASPMRGSISGSVAGGPRVSVSGGQVWTGKLNRTSGSYASLAAAVEKAAGLTSELSARSIAGTSGEVGEAEDGGVSSSVPTLPSIKPVAGTPPKPPPGPGVRSRGPSPARTAGHSLDSAALQANMVPVPLRPRPGGGIPLPHGGNSPARTARSVDSLPPNGNSPMRAPSPSRLGSTASPLGAESSSPALGTPPRPPSVARGSSRGPSPMRASLASLNGSPPVPPASGSGSRGPSPRRSLAGSVASLSPSTGDWKADHDQRKAVLAGVYLSSANLAPAVAGSGVKAVRRTSPGVSRPEGQGGGEASFDGSLIGTQMFKDVSQPIAAFSGAGGGGGGGVQVMRAGDGTADAVASAAARRYSGTELDASGELA